MSSGEDWLRGARVRVTTATQEVIEGHVYAHDPLTQTLTLSECV